MKFKILGTIHRIISITKETIITTEGRRPFHPLNDFSYFKFKNFDIHKNLPWHFMVSEMSIKKLEYLTTFLIYLKIVHNPLYQKPNTLNHLIL